jgi:hypothetical protein
LKLLVLSGNSLTATIKQLQDADIDVSKDTLRHWRDSSFRERYAETRTEMADRVGKELAGRSMERALQADEVQSRMIAELSEKVGEIPAKDLPRGIQALAQAKGSDVDKAQLLRDRPTEIKEHRSVQELMGVLVSVPGLIVEDGGTGSPADLTEAGTKLLEGHERRSESEG